MTDKDIRYAVTAEDRFSRTFANLRRDIAATSGQFGSLASAAGRGLGLLTGGAVVTVAGLGLALRQVTKDIDALNDASDAVGDSVENLSALEDVARRNGESIDLVVTAVSKLNKVLGEAKADSPVAKALESIGLNAAELRNVAPTEALRQLAVALQGVENDGNKARLVQDLFGKSLKDVAPFLKDVAETQQLNATVTTQAAAAAERFNKELFALSTNSGNAARGLASDLLPVLNEVFARIKAGREVFGTFGQTLLANLGEKTFSDAGAGVKFYTDRLKSMRVALTNLETRGTGIFDKLNAERLREQVAEAEKLEKFYRRIFALTAGDAGQSDPTELARRGRGKPALTRLPDVTDTRSGEKKISEADRYLERLQREGEKLQELTAVQQLLADIENKRIDGLTPKQEARLRQEAAYVDLLRGQTKELKAQQQALDDLIADRSQRASELDGILAATPTGRAKDIERRVDVVLKFARANPEDDAIQRQALEAVRQLNDEFKGLQKPFDDATDKVDKLGVTIDRFAESSIDALVEIGATGKLSVGSLFESFRRDVLRALIEDPVKDSMRNVVSLIRTELGKLDGANNPLATLFKFLSGAGSSLMDSVAGFFGAAGTGGGGFTGRANGGNVRAGELVRWMENGREWFVPQTDGTVVTQAQMQAASGAAYSPSYSFSIQGGDPQETARQVRAMLDERDARLIRSMRNGKLRAV